MEKYAAAKRQARSKFDRDYYRALHSASGGDVRKASKISGIEIDHLKDRSKLHRITYERKAPVYLSPRNIQAIQRQLQKRVPYAAIALRYGIGRGQVSKIGKFPAVGA